LKTMFTKRKGVLLIIMAPVLFVISGLFLANTVVWPAESIPYMVGQVLCFLVAPSFLISGILVFLMVRRAEKKKVKLAQPPIAPHPEETLRRVCPKCHRDLTALPEDIAVCPYCGKTLERARPPKTEVRIRKVLGVLLLASALPFTIFFGIIGMGLSLPSILTIVVIFGIYLLRNKGYHLVTDLFFVCIGLVAYIVPVSLFLGFFFPPVAPLPMLKGFFLTADWAHEGVGRSNPELFLVLFLTNILFFSSALFLFTTDIFSKIKRVTVSSKRGLIVALTLLVIFGVVFTLPWLHKIEIGGSAMGAFGPGPGSGIMLGLKLPPENTTAYFDMERGTWVYQIELVNTHAENAEIIGLKGKSMAGKTVNIAPPFGDNVEIIGGNKSSEKITISPSGPTLKPALLRIYSNEPLLLITWVEKNNRTGWQIPFWT